MGARTGADEEHHFLPAHDRHAFVNGLSLMMNDVVEPQHNGCFLRERVKK